MRRLVSDLCFTAALLIGIVCAAQAQFNNFPPGVFSGRAALDAAPSGGGCSQATTYNTANSITGTDATNYTNLICTIVAANGNTWAGFDMYYEFGAPSTGIALNDLTGNHTATTTGSPTFTANLGYAVDPSNSIIVIANQSSLTYFIQNSGFMGAWFTNNRTSANGGFVIVGSGNARNFINPFETTFGMDCRINEGVSAGSLAVTTTLGLSMCSRDSSTNTNQFKNGVSGGGYVAVSTTVQNQTLIIQGDNIGMFAMGQDMSALAATIFNAECTFKKAYGNAGGLC